MRKVMPVIIGLMIMISSYLVYAQDESPTPNFRERVAATATAYAMQATEEVQPEEPTENPIFLTATAIIGDATATAGAPIMATPTFTPLPPNNIQSGQVDSDIPFGEPIEGNLTAEISEARYDLNLSEGTSISIDVQSDDFDTYIQVLDSTGAIVIENDDGGVGTNSAISSFAPMTPGKYTIVVTSFGAVNGGQPTPGSFVLLVDTFTPDTIAYGKSVSGSLFDNKARYNFQGAEGDQIIVNLSSDDFDSFISLEKDGIEIAYDDDGGESTNSLLGPFALPEDGIYTLVASSYTSGESGNYTLSLTRAESVRGAFNETLNLQFTDQQTMRLVTFDVTEDDVVNVNMVGRGSYILRDPEGYSVNEGEISQTGPQISNLIPYSAGTYTLVITSEPGSTVSVTIKRGSIPSLEEISLYTFSESTNNIITSFDVVAGEQVRFTISIVEGEDYWDISGDIVQDDVYVGYFSVNQSDSFSYTRTFDEGGEVRLSLTSYSYPLTVNIELERLGMPE